LPQHSTQEASYENDNKETMKYISAVTCRDWLAYHVRWNVDSCALFYTLLAARYQIYYRKFN